MARVVLRVRVLQVGHLAAVDALAFTEDGSILASGSEDGTLRIWRAESGDQLVRRIMPAAPTSLAWMPGGRALLCGTGDRHRLVSEPVSFGAAGGRIAAGPSARVVLCSGISTPGRRSSWSGMAVRFRSRHDAGWPPEYSAPQTMPVFASGILRLAVRSGC